MIHRFVPLAPVVACALLAACSSGGNKAQQGDAPVEILPGTVSDSMLAEDRLRSEPEIDRSAARTVSDNPAAAAATEASDAAEEAGDAAAVAQPDANVEPAPNAPAN